MSNLISDVREGKRDLEAEILRLLSAYKKRWGLSVVAVYVDSYDITKLEDVQQHVAVGAVRVEIERI